MSADKEALRRELRAAIARDHEKLVAAQELTSSGIVHPDARSEGSKDMRATEASYIARGQAQRAEALARDLALVDAMPLRRFGEGDAIALSAWVTLADDDGHEQELFVAPAGGGIELVLADRVIRTVTPAAPIGRALIGARLGDEVEVPRGEEMMRYAVVAIR